MAVKLSTTNIRSIALFEKITKVHAKDCILTDTVMYFLVDEGQVGMAIGKNGVNVKAVSKVLEKPVKVIPYADSPEQIIKNLIPSALTITRNESGIVVTVPPKDKTTAIGRNGENIKILKLIMKRYFDIDDLKIR